MSLVFKVSPDRFDRASLDRFAEALASTNPPLSEKACKEISLIQQRRLSTLEGEDRNIAARFFEYAGMLPPLEGAQVHDRLTTVLPYLEEYHRGNLVFPKKEVRSETGREGPTEMNEWGYVEFSVMGGNSPRLESIYVDMQRSIREGNSACVSLFRTLFELNKPVVAQQLVDDLGTIILHRFDIDILANAR